MAKQRRKIAAPVKALKGQELLYRKELNRLGKALIVSVRKNVLAYLKAQESAYVLDNIGHDLGKIFNQLNATFEGVITAGFAANTATKMVVSTTKANKKRFDKSIFRATGVDLGNVIATEGLQSFVEVSINKNVGLITSLPEQYLGQVETIVNNGVASGARYKTIAKEILGIKGVNGKLAGRIKTIATNEIQTINSQLTLRRSDSLGITKGIFRTSKDQRVRKSHEELEGVEYVLKKGAWSKTAGKFIQPGITDINCRCDYSPIIEFAEV